MDWKTSPRSNCLDESKEPTDLGTRLELRAIRKKANNSLRPVKAATYGLGPGEDALDGLPHRTLKVLAARPL